jgi:hypothetical protein
LIIMKNEEDAFWTFYHILEIIRDYHCPSLFGSLVSQITLEVLLDREIPKVATHLREYGLDLATVTTQWFLCMLIKTISIHLVVKIWDFILFSKSDRPLILAALTIFSLKEKEIVSCDSTIDLIQILKSFELSSVLPKDFFGVFLEFCVKVSDEYYILFRRGTRVPNIYDYFFGHSFFFVFFNSFFLSGSTTC